MIIFIEGYALVFNIEDRSKDIFPFDVIIQQPKEIVCLWNHQHNDPIGLVKYCIADNIGLRVGIEINPPMHRKDHITALLNNKLNRHFSIGFRIIKSYKDFMIRYLQEIELLEISIVSVPCQALAIIDTIKYLKYSENNNLNSFH